MKREEFINLVNARELTGIERDDEFNSICASDLMSEVLLMANPGCLIVTNLLNLQTVRTAEMVEAAGVLFVRGKTPTKEMIELAKDNEIPLYVTDMTMFEACGKLYDAGLKPGNRTV